MENKVNVEWIPYWITSIIIFPKCPIPLLCTLIVSLQRQNGDRKLPSSQDHQDTKTEFFEQMGLLSTQLKHNIPLNWPICHLLCEKRRLGTTQIDLLRWIFRPNGLTIHLLTWMEMKAKWPLPSHDRDPDSNEEKRGEIVGGMTEGDPCLHWSV